MEINCIKKVKVNAKTISIHTKISDRFQFQILDQDGEILLDQEDGYVPEIMPGQHYGDYIILDIDLDTGFIKNWKKIEPSLIEELIKKEM